MFAERDDQGLWGVAYRPDKLLLMRVPGHDMPLGKLRAVMLATLPPPRSDTAPPSHLPEGIVFANVCVDSGLRATSICPDVVREPFLKGSQPADWCPLRHEVHSTRSERR